MGSGQRYRSKVPFQLYPKPHQAQSSAGRTKKLPQHLHQLRLPLAHLPGRLRILVDDTPGKEPQSHVRIALRPRRAQESAEIPRQRLLLDRAQLDGLPDRLGPGLLHVEGRVDARAVQLKDVRARLEGRRREELPGRRLTDVLARDVGPGVVDGRGRGVEEGGLPFLRGDDGLDRGGPVLHEVAGPDEDHLRGGVLQDRFGGVVGENLALESKSAVSVQSLLVEHTLGQGGASYFEYWRKGNWKNPLFRGRTAPRRSTAAPAS